MFTQKPTVKLNNKIRNDNNEINIKENNNDSFNEINDKSKFKKLDKKLKKKLQNISPIRNCSDFTYDSELFESNRKNNKIDKKIKKINKIKSDLNILTMKKNNNNNNNFNCVIRRKKNYCNNNNNFFNISTHCQKSLIKNSSVDKNEKKIQFFFQNLKNF
jgi:hypothetical protein